MRSLPDNSIDLVATDPPYFRVKNELWDRQWDTAQGFIDWIGTLCGEWRRVLKPNGSLYVFASPDMATRVETKIGEIFNVLNNIRWIKEQGWHKKADEGALRSYLSPWEAVVFAEQFGANQVTPLGAAIRDARTAAGLRATDIDIALGYVRTKEPERGTELCRRWEEGSSIPTENDFIRAMRRCSGVALDNQVLRQEYHSLRRSFSLNGLRDDLWRFDTVPPYDGKHPCEKPLALMEHIIKTSSRPGDTVLDCFLGSGVTLRAAKNLGRQAVGIEYVERYCHMASQRLSPAFESAIIAAESDWTGTLFEETTP